MKKEMKVYLVRKRSSDYLLGVCKTYLDARLYILDQGTTLSEYYIQQMKVIEYK